MFLDHYKIFVTIDYVSSIFRGGGAHRITQGNMCYIYGILMCEGIGSGSDKSSQ